MEREGAGEGSGAVGVTLDEAMACGLRSAGYDLRHVLCVRLSLVIQLAAFRFRRPFIIL